MASILWGDDVAAVYDVTSVAMYAPDVVGPAVSAPQLHHQASGP